MDKNTIGTDRNPERPRDRAAPIGSGDGDAHSNLKAARERLEEIGARRLRIDAEEIGRASRL